MVFLQHRILYVFVILLFTSCGIDIDVQPEVKKDGTEFLSFCLTDGVNNYPAFSINDTNICISVSRQTDLSSLKACFYHNGNFVSCNGLKQASGETINDYSDFVNPLVFRVESVNGDYKDYTVRLFDIPVVLINTEGKAPITNKVDWIPANIRIFDTGGRELLNESVSIKGRGNATWTSYPKKSYSLKFDGKTSLFGFPKSKRWVLLGTSGDWTKLRTPLCFKLSELLGTDWTPRGRNVEFILNDTLLCNYFLCEQIRVEKDRINIQEMSPTDTIGEALTGGVLFEVDRHYDEEYKFKAEISGLPFMLRNPDKNVHEKQLAYFRDFINTVEKNLYTPDSLSKNTYLKYLDIDSYIRWWLLNEMTLDVEGSWTENNFHMYKDRGYTSKLHAGPAWDFDWGTLWSTHIAERATDSNGEIWICKHIKWYSKLFESDVFIDRVKYIWEKQIKSINSSIVDYYSEIRNYNKNSVLRDQALYPLLNEPDNVYANSDNGLDYDIANEMIFTVLMNRIDWLNSTINGW